jgi:peptide/nickel transport system ATP-binding protein
VVISAALAGNPRLVVLDEPTTALDKTTETQVLELVQRLRSRFNATLVYVSHDLNVISEMCDRVLVMLEGRVVEEGATAQVYGTPAHDYTRRLIAAVPRIDRDPGPLAVPSAPEPLLSVRGMGYRYASRRLWPWSRRTREEPDALADVSFDILPGETLGLVGESGSGKSTAAAVIAGLLAPAAGTIRFAGQPLPPLAAGRSAQTRRRIQIIFQDPLSSLNPRHRIDAILARPLALFHGLSGAAARRRSVELLEALQLDPGFLDCYPRQLSGGQQQRVAIARAIVTDPTILVADEPTGDLDRVSAQEVLELMSTLVDQFGTTIIMVTHDPRAAERASRLQHLDKGVLNACTV